MRAGFSISQKGGSSEPPISGTEGRRVRPRTRAASGPVQRASSEVLHARPGPVLGTRTGLPCRVSAGASRLWDDSRRHTGNDVEQIFL